MAGHRRIDYTAWSGENDSAGTQRTPDLVAEPGVQPIRSLQRSNMKIEQGETFLVYDCELLFQAQDQEGETYMVSHAGECGMECRYIAVPVDEKPLSQYKAGQMDLRDLMLARGRKTWYSARTTGNPGELALEQQQGRLSESEDLPRKGFHHDFRFSRNQAG